MTTLQIPTRQLAVGATVFGPLTINNATTAVISIDRTVVGGLNALAADSTLDLLIEVSPDGGSTWKSEAECQTLGGVFSDRHGQVNVTSIAVGPIAPGNRARVTATVAGPSPITVAGSLTVT